jgi:hypothetical protein
MNIKDLKPAKDFANMFGVKCIVYGPPGSGKTPLLNTAPRPLLLACEPGLLSMRNSTVPTYQGFTVDAIEQFFKWFFNSEETKNFDTIAVDSISQMSDIFLQQALKENKHGLKAYGEMAIATMSVLRGLYYTRNKHTYLIAKEAANDDNGIRYRKPYMPGQQLPVELPHLFDEILHLGLHNIPGVGTHKAFRCQASIDILARDRTGMLAEFESPDFNALIRKAMS